ncbi:DUF58 domain-containing protein [Haloarcula litorea]|uniref:DUF58 domain-containing protein n=1 Tax=Haloarcula litorea TaxID=3032579 RepID=UPI0023E8DC5C|nr:DUF58 domain-containing protein [Halomicroarcula sp. GDY20]
MRRGLAVAVGLAAFALGTVALVSPASLPLSVDRVAVAVLGVTALALAGRRLRVRYLRPVERARTADVERRPETPPPGGALDEVFAADGTEGYLLGEGTRQQGRLRRVAVEALVRDGADRASARERVERGTWTDDRTAAAFLARGDAADERSPAGLRGLVGGEPSYETRLGAAVDAVAARAGHDFDGGGDDAEPSVRERLRARVEHVDRAPPEEAMRREAPTTRSTDHWLGVGAAALAALGVGVLTRQPAAMLLGVVGVGYAAYARSRSPPDPTLTVERSLSETEPRPGDPVTVELAVTNDGATTLPDLRVVDGVPPGLAVTDGTPRHGTALRPGETATVEYTVTARRGRHEFGPVHALVRDVAGATAVSVRVDAATPTTIACRPTVRAPGVTLPLREPDTRRTGRVATSDGGAGTEFFATREYRAGDPLGRVDWHHRAKTGDLATVEFRTERTAPVVVLVDTTPRAVVGPEADGVTALDRSVAAAGELLAAGLGAGHRVGLAALTAPDCWLPPGSGDDHRARARELLATDPALSAATGDHDRLTDLDLDWLRGRLPAGAQVVVVSPLLERGVAAAVRRLDAHGHPVTVVSPAPTSGRTPATRLAAVLRGFRCSDLRAAGVPVADWDWDEPLAVATDRLVGGRSG